MGRKPGVKNRPKGEAAATAAKPAAKNDLVSKIKAALDFVSVVNFNPSEPWKDVVALNQGWIFASDGVLTVGCPTGIEDLNCCPNYNYLKQGVSKCGANPKITLGTHLNISSGKFTVDIPIMPFEQVPPISFDDAVVGIGDTITAGFEMLSPLISSAAEYAISASLLLQNGSMVATDRAMMIEYWHGWNLPTTVLPKVFIDAVVATKKKLARFGYSPNSVTFYFEDGSFIKTQQFAIEWPDYKRVLEKPGIEYTDLPLGLFDAVEAVMPFSPDGTVWFDNMLCCSHEGGELGAVYECEGVTGAYKARRLMMLKDKKIKMQFNPDHAAAFFMCNEPPFRGAIASREFRGTPDKSADAPVPEAFKPPATPAQGAQDGQGVAQWAETAAATLEPPTASPGYEADPFAKMYPGLNKVTGEWALEDNIPVPD